MDKCLEAVDVTTHLNFCYFTKVAAQC